MNDGFLFVGLMIVFVVMIMGIGIYGDYTMRHQSEVIKECECK